MRALIFAAVTVAAATASADGTLTAAVGYYKERATRVEQPMLDSRFDVGDNGTISAHFLVDAITSASAAAGGDGTAFSEKRVESGVGYSHLFDTITAGATVRFSSEPDYTSAFATLRGQVELFDKNLTLGVTAGLGRDEITNDGIIAPVERITGTLGTYLVSVSAAQILDANTIAALTYDLSYLDGFQQNPYRQVAAGGMPVRERHPEERTRHAVAPQLRRFLPATETTIVANYRYYRDDWGVRGHTPELRVIQAVGDTVEVGAGYRYHRQTAAEFWAAMYPDENAPFLTRDGKLAPIRTHDLSARLAVTGATFDIEGRWEDVRGELVFDYYMQDDRYFGNAAIAYASLTIPFEY